jgi:hypothetical protein
MATHKCSLHFFGLKFYLNYIYFGLFMREKQRPLKIALERENVWLS